MSKDISDITLYEEKKPNRVKSVITAPPKTSSYYNDENIKFFTVNEFESLITGISNQFNKMAVILLYETGGRVEECRAVKFADIDSVNLKIKILTLKQRKKNLVYRYLKISDKLMNLILTHRLNINLSPDDFILAQKSGASSITRKGLSLILRRQVISTLGLSCIDKAHPHALRHTRAIHLLDSGMNIMLVKNFLGHANIINTLIYLKYSDKDLFDAIDKANNQFICT